MTILTRVYLIAFVILLALVLAPLALAGPDVTAVDDAGNLAAWASITGVLLPFAAAFILRHKWTSQTKAIAVGVLAVIDGIVVTGFTSGWDSFWPNGLVAIAAVFALARVTYAGLWSHIGPDPADPDAPNAIKKLERATG